MSQNLFDLRTPQNDLFDWSDVPFKKNTKSPYTVNTEAISLHSGWANMHFHFIEREKYTISINFYDIRKGRRTTVTADTSTVEFTIMMNNFIWNQLGGLPAANLKKGDFNLTYLPFLESITELTTDQFYLTFDIHLKESLLNELVHEYPSIMEPFMNGITHKQAITLFSPHAPADAFMWKIIESIFGAINKGKEYYTIMDKDVKALIVHAITFDTSANHQSLDKERLQLLSLVYSKLMNDPTVFPGIKALCNICNTNQNTLNLMFKEVFKTTIRQCWLELHLDFALNLVVHERDRMIKDISNTLAYSCEQNFIRAFKTKFKMTPSAYRNKNGDIDPFFQEML